MTTETLESLLLQVYGYIELEMGEDANEALESLPNKVKSHPLVLSARLDLLMLMERWEEGAILGLSLAKLWPNHFDFWIHSAFCLHELKRTAEAKQTLLDAPMAIREAALYSYNLACYEAQLGQHDKAKALLAECFIKDKTMRNGALDDPDLEPVWDSIARGPS